MNSGKLSCILSVLSVFILYVIRVISFDSIMPYLIGIVIWAILWQIFDSRKIGGG